MSHWLLRPTTPEDIPYVASTWMHQVRQHSRWLRNLPDGMINDSRGGYRCHLAELLARVTGIAAVDPEQPDILYGYAYAEPPITHFVYVRAPFRRQGLARSMLERAGVPAPLQITMDAPRWAVRKYGLDHDPFCAPIHGVRFRAWCIAERTAFGDFEVKGIR